MNPRLKYLIFEFVWNLCTRLVEKELLMQIITQCPTCGNRWLLDADSADRRIRCHKCRRLFKVPKLDEIPKAIKVIKHAKSNIYVDQNGKSYG